MTDPTAVVSNVQGLALIDRNTAKQEGLVRYFTGVPCVKGHIDQRYTKDGQCCECSRDKLKARYKKDPDRWKQIAKDRNANLSDDVKARRAAVVRAKRKSNPELFRIYDASKQKAIKNDPARREKERLRQLAKQKRAYRENPDHYKEIARKRHAENRELNNALSRQWKRDNPEKVKALNEKWGSISRAHRLKRIPRWLTEEDYRKINEIYKEARTKGMHVDHIIPLQGKNVSGLHVPSNLQLLTCSENASKGNRYEVDQ